jgi:hypothetical protein
VLVRNAVVEIARLNSVPSGIDSHIFDAARLCVGKIVLAENFSGRALDYGECLARSFDREERGLGARSPTEFH